MSRASKGPRIFSLGWRRLGASEPIEKLEQSRRAFFVKFFDASDHGFERGAMRARAIRQRRR